MDGDKDVRSRSQEEASDIVIKNKRGTVILPTGYGKTRVGKLVWDKLGSPSDTLVFTSKRPIVSQWRQSFEGKGEFLCFNSYNKTKKKKIQISYN